MRRLAIHAAAIAMLVMAFGTSGASAAAPTIAKTGVSKVTTDSATLQADVNPQGKATLYRFEYGPGDCSISACASVPVPEGELPGGSSPVAVTFSLKGLTAGTTYHLRVVAANGDGETPGPDHIFATYVLPFEGLPDGRAYEQASPVKKNAADARGMVAWAKAADDGNAISFLSTSGIPGGKGEQELPAYLASRGSTNWSTQGLLPPANRGSEAYVRGWLPDFSEVFDYATDFGGESDGTFLARSSADGSITPIVEHGEGLDFRVDSLSYAGASADGREVLFEANDKLSCCDEAIGGKSNVYLWDRESKQTSLVSVLNDEKSAPSGAFAGPYDWMLTPDLPLTANSGGSSRNYYTQDEHTISADGNTVYFTAAGSGELYARINPTAGQSPLDGEGKCTNPALACTLNLSASHRTPPDPLGSRPAAFMAASKDGSTAFFASPEELTEDANTGPEQPEPAIERADIDGDPIETSFPIAASGIAVDAAHIYWVNPSGSAIGRSEIGGGNPEPLFIPIPPLSVGPVGEEKDVPAKPQYVAVDAGHIYWTSEGNGENGEGVIGRADITGTPASVQAECIKGASRPKGIAVNDTHIFWGNAGADLPVRGIGRAKLDCSEVNQKFVPDTGTRFPQGVAVDSAHIYWSIVDGDNGSIRRTDIDGSNEQFKFISTGAQLRGVAVDSGHVYWASQGEESIGRAKLDLTDLEPTFIEVGAKPKGLALDATHLYWSVNGEVVPNPGNDLYHYDTGSEELIDLTADSADANGAEVKGILSASADARRVYFAANGDLDGAGPAAAGNCRGEFGAVLAGSGQCSLYLLEETAPGSWSTTYITRLDAAGDAKVSDVTNWTGRGGQAGQYEKSALASADGGILLFRSQQQLGDYDNEGQPQLYRYEAGGEDIACISCNPTGQAPAGAPRLGSIGLSALIPQADPAYVLTRNLSAEGTRVFFESTDPLVIDDTNGEDGCKDEGAALFRLPSCLDVYEWEAQGTGSCKEDVQAGGCLYLLSTGTSPQASYFADASVNGDDAFLATRSAGLVRQDEDLLQDVYDARAGGGLAAQNQQPVPICESTEGCHGASPPPPGFHSPASANFSGPGNSKTPRAKKPCPKGKVRRGGKCVKRPGKAKPPSKHRPAGNHRRAEQ